MAEQQEASKSLGWLTSGKMDVSQLEDEDTLFSWLHCEVKVKK